MSSYVIEVNERELDGKLFIDFLKSIEKISDYFKIVPHKTNKRMKKAITLTEEEMERIEKSRKSGVGSLDELKKYLKQ